MGMLLALLSQLALAHNPLAIVHPKLIGGPVFRASDYPIEAERHLWSGTVVADLTINPRGRVDGCKIVQTSGHKVLDDTTCSILVDRARFQPARDQNGNAVEDVMRTPEVPWKVIP